MAESSSHKKRFDAHPLHNSVLKWLDKTDAEKPDNYSSLPQEARDTLDRLRWVLTDLQSRLAASDPFNVQTRLLELAHKKLRNLSTPWAQFIADPANTWKQLDAHIEDMLATISDLGQGGQQGTYIGIFDELRAKISKATSNSIEMTNNTKTLVEDLASQLSRLKSEIDTQKGRLDSALTNQGEAFAKAEQDRGTQFVSSEKERWKEFKAESEAQAAGWGKRANSVILSYDQALSEVLTRAEDTRTSIQKELDEQLEKAIEIVGTVVNTAMTGHYQIVARREYRNAWLMRCVAIAAFIAMGFAIVWAATAINVGENGINWTTVAIRASLAITFLVPGLYCGRESSRHWDAEKRNRRIGLELASLEPFIAQLDEEKQKEIIERMAAEYFGKGVRPDDDTRGGQSLKNLNLRGDELLKVVEQIASIARGK